MPESSSMKVNLHSWRRCWTLQDDSKARSSVTKTALLELFRAGTS